MTHHRSYEPVEAVVLDDTLIADVVVTARLDLDTDTPLGLVVQDLLTLHLTIPQWDALISAMQRARADVVRGADVVEDDDE